MLRPCAGLLRYISLAKADRMAMRTILFKSRGELSNSFLHSPTLSAFNFSAISRRPYSNSAAQSSTASENQNSAKSTMEAEGGASAAAQPTDKQIEELLATIQSYKEKLSTTEDKYRRQLAETENVRQRFMRQVDEAKTFGIQNFCKDLLEISDVLALATESVPKEELSKSENAALKQLYDGVVMTQSQLTKIFNKHGLVAVRPLGEKFNPNIHEAVFQVKDDSKEAGSIANVVKIGYLLHDRLIRPAKVGVYISS